MAKSLNNAQLNNASGGIIRNASSAERTAAGGDAIVVEGVMRNGKYGSMIFSKNKFGDKALEKAHKFARDVGISTDVNTAQGADTGSSILKDYL